MHTQTPKKRKEKILSNIKNIYHDEPFCKNNLSPFAEAFISFLPTLTPCKNQLQYLNSPQTTNKDLFLQLLGT